MWVWLREDGQFGDGSKPLSILKSETMQVVWTYFQVCIHSDSGSLERSFNGFLAWNEVSLVVCSGNEQLKLKLAMLENPHFLVVLPHFPRFNTNSGVKSYFFAADSSFLFCNPPFGGFLRKKGMGVTPGQVAQAVRLLRPVWRRAARCMPVPPWPHWWTRRAPGECGWLRNHQKDGWNMLKPYR